MDDSPEPDPTRTALHETLDGQRRHVLGILEGLSDDDLRRPVLPSGWTCAGLVRHLALDVERFWFGSIMAGEAVDMNAGDDAWQLPPDQPASTALDTYREEIARADAFVLATPLEAEPLWWPTEWAGWRVDDLREVLLHVITETACHAGHLDAARELIDGRQWRVLTD